MDNFDDTTIAVYRLIERHWQEQGFAPTLREIAAACYLSPAGVLPHLDKLEQGGYVTREPGTARTIRVGKPLPEQPTPTEALYQFIVSRMDAGVIPSQREMAAAFQVSEQTIRTRLSRLEAAGRMQHQKHVSRSIVLLKE